MKLGIIYKATLPSGKIYIGQTISKFSLRISAHIDGANKKSHHMYNTKFSRALRKYKFDVKWEVLLENIPQEDLDIFEISMIKEYDSYHSGYNSNEGGNGNKGYLHTEETKKILSEKGHKLRHTDEARAKISAAGRGRIFSEERRKNISKALRGRKIDPSIVRKTAESLIKNKSVAGENHPSVKLNWNLVREIRTKFETGNYSYAKLSREYGVTAPNIRSIIKMNTWKE